MSRQSARNQRQSQPSAAALTAPVDHAIPPNAHPDHHLWKNGRLWWVAFTVHEGHQQERVRSSLGTADVVEARRRRDALIEEYRLASDLEVSLRFARRAFSDCSAARGAGEVAHG